MIDKLDIVTGIILALPGTVTETTLREPGYTTPAAPRPTGSGGPPTVPLPPGCRVMAGAWAIIATRLCGGGTDEDVRPLHRLEPAHESDDRSRGVIHQSGVCRGECRGTQSRGVDAVRDHPHVLWGDAGAVKGMSHCG